MIVADILWYVKYLKFGTRVDILWYFKFGTRVDILWYFKFGTRAGILWYFKFGTIELTFCGMYMYLERYLTLSVADFS